MKPKLMAILVIGILVTSMILTLVGAVSQAVSSEAGGQGPGGSSASLSDDGEGRDDIALVSTFKFVCPFH